MYANHSQSHDIVLQWINNETTNARDALHVCQISKLLNGLFTSKDYDENERLIYSPMLVISNKEI